MDILYQIKKDKQLQNKNIKINARASPDPDAHTPNLDFDPIRRLWKNEEAPDAGMDEMEFTEAESNMNDLVSD